jgi:hypothetical protein
LRVEKRLEAREEEEERMEEKAGIRNQEVM